MWELKSNVENSWCAASSYLMVRPCRHRIFVDTFPESSVVLTIRPYLQFFVNWRSFPECRFELDSHLAQRFWVWLVQFNRHQPAERIAMRALHTLRQASGFCNTRFLFVICISQRRCPPILCARGVYTAKAATASLSIIQPPPKYDARAATNAMWFCQ